MPGTPSEERKKKHEQQLHLITTTTTTMHEQSQQFQRDWKKSNYDRQMQAAHKRIFLKQKPAFVKGSDRSSSINNTNNNNNDVVTVQENLQQE